MFQSDAARLNQARDKAEGKAEAVLEVLAARSLPITADQRARILASRDLEELDRWLIRTVTAAIDVFEP